MSVKVCYSGNSKVEEAVGFLAVSGRFAVGFVIPTPVNVSCFMRS